MDATRRLSAARRAWTAGSILAVLLVCGVPQVVLAARLWTLVGTPLTASVGVSTAVTLNVQNIGGSGGGDEIGCVQIDVPTSFSISSGSSMRRIGAFPIVLNRSLSEVRLSK